MPRHYRPDRMKVCFGTPNVQSSNTDLIAALRKSPETVEEIAKVLETFAGESRVALRHSLLDLSLSNKDDAYRGYLAASFLGFADIRREAARIIVDNPYASDDLKEMVQPDAASGRMLYPVHGRKGQRSGPIRTF